MVAYTKELLNNRKHTPSLSKFQLKKDLDKNGSIADVLVKVRKSLCRLQKSLFRPRVRDLRPNLYCSRYLVLMPFADKVLCIPKIKSQEERNRIKQLMRSIKPKNFGVIVRTVLRGVDVKELMPNSGRW
jgi:ribonuclease G